MLTLPSSLCQPHLISQYPQENPERSKSGQQQKQAQPFTLPQQYCAGHSKNQAENKCDYYI
jgi:hypothetical protein